MVRAGRNFGAPATLGYLMCPQTRRFLAGAATLLALAAAGPAHAAEASPGEVAKAAAAKKKKGPSRGEKAVAKTLRNAVRKKRISRRSYNRYRKLYSRTRKTRKRLKGARGRELGAVIRALDRIALGKALKVSRMPALFLILERNRQFWPRKPFPRNRDRVSFRGSELVFEYYAGKGLQLQPLVNFKKANLMHGACVKAAGEPCNRAGLAKLLREMVKTSSRRGPFRPGSTTSPSAAARRRGSAAWRRPPASRRSHALRSCSAIPAG